MWKNSQWYLRGTRSRTMLWLNTKPLRAKKIQKNNGSRCRVQRLNDGLRMLLPSSQTFEGKRLYKCLNSPSAHWHGFLRPAWNSSMKEQRAQTESTSNHNRLPLEHYRVNGRVPSHGGERRHYQLGNLWKLMILRRRSFWQVATEGKITQLLFLIRP